MKKLLLAILTLGITHSTFAQFSTSGNITSTTNNVGIGTATPAYTLGVMGNGFHFQSTIGNHAEILLRDGSIEDPKTASDNGGWAVNYNGYSGGTYFRNFTIFNGKGTAIANFNGSNSSVGIGTGTLSPLSKLQVGSGTNNQGSLTAMFGNAASSAAVNALSLVNSAPAGSGNEVDMTFHTANNYSPTAQIGAIAEAVQPTTDMAFSTFDAPTGLTEKIRILGNGNVGIGTTTPFAKLHIKTANDLNPNNIGSTNFDNRHLAIGSTGANASSLAFSKNCTPNGSAYITSATIGLSWDPIGFQASNYNWFSGGSTTPNMVLNASGYLGLGITNPQNKLDVNGTIHSQAVRVDMNGWSDFVFNSSYSLASLSTIKNYLDQNHHLPDMPSEKEITQNGINVGDMLKLQTQKIEELTLYLIEKDQQLKDQKKEIEQLKQKQEARIAALEQILSKLTSNSKY